MARIMIVEDDDALRSVLRRSLETEGHQVIEEPDGGSALRHFAGDPADLVVSDVFMPVMDGIDFLMRVRDAFPEARIIVMSGGGDLGKTSVLDAAARLGADGVLEKPFEIAEFLEMVRATLAA